MEKMTCIIWLLSHISLHMKEVFPLSVSSGLLETGVMARQVLCHQSHTSKAPHTGRPGGAGPLVWPRAGLPGLSDFSLYLWLPSAPH